MAYNALNNLIDAYIYANGVQAITGQILNGVLKQMVSQLGSGYHLMGVAGPETVPASNDYAMAYFAATAGEYTDFGGITLAAGEVAVLLTYGNGSWSKQTIYNVPTGTADLENTANFITNAVTDLVNYYTKTEVDDTLANYPTLEALATALADYYTKQEIDGQKAETDAALADRYTKSETDTKLADYYRKTETYDKDEVDSIVAALSRQSYVVSWNGTTAPDVSAIPAGVTVTYSGTTYTGTLAASAATVNKIYMVWNGTAYDMYGTSQDGGYSWVPMGTTTVDLSQYATKAEVNQLEAKVMENVNLLLASIGEYAFPNGRPSLPWNDTEYSVTNNLTGLSTNNPSLVVYEHHGYYARLSTIDTYGIIDSSSVIVTMGGTDVTSSVYTAGEINITDVTGDIVITAASKNYISDGLVFRLDGRHKGNTAGHWIDDIGNIDFTLTDCTEEDDGVSFNGTSSKGVSSGTLNVLFSAGTIEVVYDASNSGYPTTYPQIILTNSVQLGIAFGLSKNGSVNSYVYAQATSATSLTEPTMGWNNNSIQTKAFMSISTQRCYVNGVSATSGSNSQKDAFGMDSSTGLAIGYRHRTGGDSFYKGKILAIRVYSRQLTQAEILNNYAVDSNRYTI